MSRTDYSFRDMNGLAVRTLYDANRYPGISVILNGSMVVRIHGNKLCLENFSGGTMSAGHM